MINLVASLAAASVTARDAQTLRAMNDELTVRVGTVLIEFLTPTQVEEHEEQEASAAGADEWVTAYASSRCEALPSSAVGQPPQRRRVNCGTCSPPSMRASCPTRRCWNTAAGWTGKNRPSGPTYASWVTRPRTSLRCITAARQRIRSAAIR